MLRLIAVVVLVVALVFAIAPVHAASPPANAPASTGQEVPPKVQSLLELLKDPAVQDWLKNLPQTAPTPAATSPVAADESPMAFFADRERMVRAHFRDLGQTVPDLPALFGQAFGRVSDEIAQYGALSIVLLLLAFVVFGTIAERLLIWASRGLHHWAHAQAHPGQHAHLPGLLATFLLGLLRIAAFAVGCLVATTAFDWPPLTRSFALGYLVASVVLRTAMVLGRTLLGINSTGKTEQASHRLIPMDDASARFWYRRSILLVGWFMYGWVSVALLHTLGFTLPAMQIVAYLLGIGLLAIGLDMIWRRPARIQPIDGQMPRRLGSFLVTGYFILLWALWVAHAVPALWISIIVVGLPAAIRLADRSVEHVVHGKAAGEEVAHHHAITAVVVARGIRAVLIVGSVLLLARAWHIDLINLTASSDTVATRLERGALSAAIIILVADFLWKVIRVILARAMLGSGDDQLLTEEEFGRRQRLRTLLPILSHMMLGVLCTMVVLMILSAMGVEIMPLLAGAGVVGVALGFGAQTLVRDIISGIFYLADDAFRVGEYIQSGSYKGTVESFSLRSVKLRHHRGPLFTVPFGVLGAVQNMSRDWVIDKLTVGVTYESDLAKVKKIIKEIGKQLLADPELKPHIIETLKMQGIQDFGDYGIQVIMKLKAKPGEQFAVRRRAFALIKQSFDANGIAFASPTVNVAGGDPATAAAALMQRNLKAAEEAQG